MKRLDEFKFTFNVLVNVSWLNYERDERCEEWNFISPHITRVLYAKLFWWMKSSCAAINSISQKRLNLQATFYAYDNRC